MANDSEQVEDGRPVAIKSSATTNGNGSQEPSPTLQVPSIIPSIKVIKVSIYVWLSFFTCLVFGGRDVTLLFTSSVQQQRKIMRMCWKLSQWP